MCDANKCGAKSPYCNMGRMPRHIFVGRAVCVLWRKRPTWTNGEKRDAESHPQLAGLDVGCGIGSTFRATIADDCNGNVSLCSTQQFSCATEMNCQLALLSELRILLTQVHSDNIHVVPKSWRILSYRSLGKPVQVHLRCVAKSGGNRQTCWLNAMGSISDAGLRNTSDQARQLLRPCLWVNGRCIWTGNPRYWSANRREELEMHDPNATMCHCCTERIFLGTFFPCTANPREMCECERDTDGRNQRSNAFAQKAVDCKGHECNSPCHPTLGPVTATGSAREVFELLREEDVTPACIMLRTTPAKSQHGDCSNQMLLIRLPYKILPGRQSTNETSVFMNFCTCNAIEIVNQALSRDGDKCLQVLSLPISLPEL